MESYQKQRHHLSPVTQIRACEIETLFVRRLQNLHPNARQAKRALRLESIQERAGQHGPWRSSHQQYQIE